MISMVNLSFSNMAKTLTILDIMPKDQPSIYLINMGLFWNSTETPVQGVDI